MGGVGIRRWFGALAGVLLCACGGGASLRTGDLLLCGDECRRGKPCRHAAQQLRGGKPLVAVGRVREADSTVVARAMQRARACLGLPYDDDFLPDNGKFYCSELVWECFLAADDSTHLFRSRPMTFRAADGSMPDYWTRHFAASGMAVPEGVAGTNPNDMAADPAVRIVWRCYD